jgi:hypothetical protein
LLAGADARRVVDLGRTIDQLRRAEKFEEAVAPAQEILTLCERAFGPDHWLTADARRQIKTIEYVIGLPEEGRKAMASVGPLESRYRELNQRARHAEAERMSRALVAIHERWLGVDHPDTGAKYNDLAVHLSD